MLYRKIWPHLSNELVLSVSRAVVPLLVSNKLLLVLFLDFILSNVADISIALCRLLMTLITVCFLFFGRPSGDKGREETTQPSFARSPDFTLGAGLQGRRVLAAEAPLGAIVVDEILAAPDLHRRLVAVVGGDGGAVRMVRLHFGPRLIRRRRPLQSRTNSPQESSEASVSAPPDGLRTGGSRVREGARLLAHRPGCSRRELLHHGDTHGGSRARGLRNCADVSRAATESPPHPVLGRASAVRGIRCTWCQEKRRSQQERRQQTAFRPARDGLAVHTHAV